jgi:hypothetical protein
VFRLQSMQPHMPDAWRTAAVDIDHVLQLLITVRSLPVTAQSPLITPRPDRSDRLAWCSPVAGSRRHCGAESPPTILLRTFTTTATATITATVTLTAQSCTVAGSETTRGGHVVRRLELGSGGLAERVLWMTGLSPGPHPTLRSA